MSSRYRHNDQESRQDKPYSSDEVRILHQRSFLYISDIYNMIDIEQIAGFEWDDGNSRKSADKHDVSQAEAESVFFNDPLIVVADVKHSEKEPRRNALGKTAQNRLLHVTFTLRQGGAIIRIISARDMHRKERRIYEQA
jgi:uncharacterized protein